MKITVIGGFFRAELFKVLCPIGLIGVFFTFLMPGCTGSVDSEHLIRVAGSSTVLPIATRAAEAFMENRRGVKITVSPGGSGIGVRSLGNGLIDIGMISRNLSAKERGRFPDTAFMAHVIAKDGVAVVVSSEVHDSGVKELTREEIQGIFTGKIDNWKTVGGPDRKILCINKEAHRGTRHVFMEYFFEDPLAIAKGTDIVSGSNNEELTKITMSDSAIGMLSAAWANEEAREIGLKVGGRAVYPTKENVRSGEYPVSRNLILLTKGEPEGVVKEFIDFLKGEKGQKIVEESGYVSIR